MRCNDFSLNGREVRLIGGGDRIVTAYVDGRYVRGTHVPDAGTAEAVACTLVAACDAVELNFVALVAGRVRAVVGI